MLYSKYWLSPIVIIVFSFMSQICLGQNYVSSGSEFTILGSIDLSTSLSWKAQRAAAPGFITWSGSSSYTNASKNHHIDGYVKKIGNTAFTFPVGSGTELRTLSISAPALASDAYAVAWISGDPSTVVDPTNSNATHSVTEVDDSIVAVSTLGQWDWMPINGNGEGLTITVSIPALPSDLSTIADDVRLVGWDGSKWISLGNSGASGLTEGSTLSGTMISGIEAIGIGAISSIVPLVFEVVQNVNGTLVVSGTSAAGATVVITFPDGSSANTVVNNNGTFQVTSLLPQSTKGVVYGITMSNGVSGSTYNYTYDFPEDSVARPPSFSVSQNSNGILVVIGTAVSGSTVLISFPDGSKVSVVANDKGYFEARSATPQANKGAVTAVATTTKGLSSELVLISYDYPVTVLSPETFTPNGDGINDTWVIYELDKYPNSTVRVYNRWGSEVFVSKDYKNDWDGHFKNSSNSLPESGAYYYQIDYGTDGSIDKEGWLYIKK